MKTIEAVKTRVNVGEKINDAISKGSLCAMAIVSGSIGIWATVVFVTALFSGPKEIVKGLFMALGF